MKMRFNYFSIKAFTIFILVFMIGINPVFADQKTSQNHSQKDSCELYGEVLDNTLVLETASLDARAKIEKIEETLNEEITLRESIIDSIKNIIGLKQNDKVVFREMKKEIDVANIYYDNLDVKIVDWMDFLDNNYCEDLKQNVVEKKVVESAESIENEAIFRKNFAASLKNKLKILQDGVKNAKSK